jgi:hypothetical protein
MNQIKYVEKHYRKISSATKNRKNELLRLSNQSQSQSFSSSISITSLHSSISASRHYDAQSNRQYELSEYALIEYVHENHSSINQQTRQTRQSNDRNQDFQHQHQAFESYVSSSKISYEKELSTLNKLYKEKKKFEDTEDNFDLKLTIYLDKCRHANLSKHAYEKKVSVMLTDETLIRYYLKLSKFHHFQ